MDEINHLQREIAKREAELADLRSQLALAESKNRDQTPEGWKWPLAEYEYERYSRQMIVPGFGLEGIYTAKLTPSKINLADHWVCRTIKAQEGQGTACWCWRSGMSGGAVSCWGGCWDVGVGGWG